MRRNMAERLREDQLPTPWSYGVMRDGRIFFINEENNETTWLHPVTGKAVGTGFNDRSDLPQGWQEGVTPSGRTYYVDHLNETTTFYHPLTGKSDMDEEYPDHKDPANNTSGTESQKAARNPSFVKKKVPKTITPLVKRDPDSVKVKEGWLQKRDHGAIAVWRKRWCILSDFCLFYYKDPTDADHVGSIMLPSYDVTPVGPKDKGTKKFAFKCVHENMRTYYFAGSTQEDMESWMSALHAASKMQTDVPTSKPTAKDEEDWGRPSTLSRDQTPNGTHSTPVSPSNAYATVHSPPVQNGRPHSWQEEPKRGYEERPVSRQDYEEVPRRAPSENASPYGNLQRDRQPPRPRSVGPGDYPRGDPRDHYPRDQQERENESPYGNPQRDRQPPRPRSVGPGDYPRGDPRDHYPRDQQEPPISRTKSLPRHSAAPPQMSLPRHTHTHDPYATMPRNRDGRPVSGPPPTYVDPREIQFRKRQQRNAQSMPPPDRRRSEPPRRPPYPNGYELDRNANYAKTPPPNQAYQQRSPMQQQPPPLSRQPDQRHNPNSPMSYDRSTPVDRRSQTMDRSTPIERSVDRRAQTMDRSTPVDRRSQTLDRSTPVERPIDRRSQTMDRSTLVDRQRSFQQERIPIPQVQAEVQMSVAPELRSSQRSLRSNTPQSPHSQSPHPQSPQSRDGMDSVDIGPTRERPPVSRNSTLREERGGDQLAPLAPMGRNRPANRPQHNQQNRGQVGQPTNRFRMWQQKTQPYILLSTGIRLRLSIAANDLIGKSHEELVLFLIQLRRDKANMEEWMSMIDDELDVIQSTPGYTNGGQQMLRSRHSDSLRRSNPNLNEDDLYETELRQEREEVSKELEVSLPLINLVDNLVRKGSLYGGQNELIAHEFYKNQMQGKDVPAITPKMMVEYSRQQEEEKLVNGIEEDYRKMETAEDREIDEKLTRLRELDQKMQEISSNVYVLKEDKDKLEQSLERLRQQYEREWENEQAQNKIEEQQIRLDRDLIRVRSHLAQGTKDLEDITVENYKLEHEIALLRMKREKEEPTENGYYPGARELMEISDEVTNVQSKMTSLDQKRAQLMEQMAGYRKEPGNGFLTPELSPAHSDQTFDYQSTDLDTEETWDISRDQFPPGRPPQPGLGRPQDLSLQRQGFAPQHGPLEEPPMVVHSQQQDQFAAPPRHPMPPGHMGPPSQYSTLERSPRQGYQTSPEAARGTPTNHMRPHFDARGPNSDPRSPHSDPRIPHSDPRQIADQRRSHDQYGRSPDDYGRSPNQMGPHPRSVGNERVIQPQQIQVAHSQPPVGHQQRGPYNDRRDQGPPSGGGDWYPQGDLRSPQSGRRSSGGSTYKVTDLDTRQSWDISQVDIIRSPVDDRPLLSPGEVLPRMDPSHHAHQGGPGSVPIGQIPSGDGPTSSLPPAALTSTSSTLLPSHDALWHGTPNPASAFTPVQIKEDMAISEGSTTSESTQVRISPLPTRKPGRRPVTTETTTNKPASHYFADDKPKTGSEKRVKPKESPSNEYHSMGFIPRSAHPGSRDSDTESTSSSIRNTTVYGPAPFRRSVEPDTRKTSKGQGGQKNVQFGQAPSYKGPSKQSHGPSFKPPSGKSASNQKTSEPLLERVTFSDTETVRPPPTRPGESSKTQKSIHHSSDDIDIGNIEKAIKAVEEDSREPRNDGVVKSSLKNVEVDESTGGGLMRTHSLPLSYLRAKRRMVKFNFFATTVHPYPSSRKLGVPGKIIIRERYNPAEDEDIEDKSKLTEEERLARDKRAKDIAKMLSTHSMQSWHPSEIDTHWLQDQGGQTPEDIRNKVNEEKLLRQETLAKTRALAEEVKQQSLRQGQQREGSDGHHHQSSEHHHWSSEEER